MFKLSIVILLSVISMTSCSKLDDYMLGKDNTASPAELKPLTSSVKLTKQWSVPLGSVKASNTFLKLKPEIVGNIIYVATPTGIVSAVNRTNGQLIWSQKLNVTLVSGPAVKQGYIALSTGASSIILLNQATGNEIWRTSISSDALATPVITNGKVIAKTIDGHLIALDLKSGKKIWAVEHGSPHLILKASSSPIVVGNNIIAGYSDGKLESVDSADGQLIWQKSIVYSSGASDVERLVDIDSDPIVQGDTLYLATYQGYLGAFSLSSGNYSWQKPASTFKNFIVSGNSIFLTDSDDVVWSFNKVNGQVNWKQTDLKARGLTEPVLLGGHLVVADKTGFVHILSTKNGDFLGRILVNTSIITAPTVAGNKLYILGDNGNLECFSVS